MLGQDALVRLLGNARFGAYLSAADGDPARAADLYLWATQLSGALHGQLSFVEIAVRNAVDGRLAEWNARLTGQRDWSGERAAADPLYSLLRRPLREARARAAREAAERGHEHPRFGLAVTHDDVVAQLTFGAWITVVRPLSTSESATRQELLWNEALADAFPHAATGEPGRAEVGRKLEVPRRLRNRVAHHDNLLRVEVQHRFNDMLSLLSRIDPTFPDLAAGRSTVRRLLREDPRRDW